MARFSQIARGAQQTDPVELRLAGVSDFVRLAVRPLRASEDEDVLECARREAAKRGVQDPKDGNPLYDFEVAIETIARGCVDIDAPASPFFDGGAEQVRRELDRDRIAYLYERQRSFQEACSPLQRDMDPSAFIAKVLEAADTEDGDRRPFDALPRASLESFARTLARQFMSLAMLKSRSGSDSAESLSDSPPPSESVG